MRRRIIGCFSIICALTLFGTTAWAANVAKIGVLDLQQVLEISSSGKAAQNQLKAEKDKMEIELKSKGKEIEELRKRLEREAMVMSKEMREQKEREGRIKVNDFKTLEKKYRKQLQKMQAQTLRRIHKEVFEITEEIGEKGGYLLVLEKHEAGIFYFPKSIDVTDQVIKEYNSRYGK